ncbi:unnamed protein product [Aspergillus oryzae var. brunneus]|uniref:Unnamed protein product n=2 Tax=Aspergillus oryzae TaxID=5062 RepID=A0AAN4Y6L3_ASPOZ|nr:unnamed protein product [Aspergillus oryzae]GMG44781.1 unnamed protein product [Aspergillus oryzae var. brunneus]
MGSSNYTGTGISPAHRRKVSNNGLLHQKWFKTSSMIDFYYPFCFLDCGKFRQERPPRTNLPITRLGLYYYVQSGGDASPDGELSNQVDWFHVEDQVSPTWDSHFGTPASFRSTSGTSCARTYQTR